MTREFKLLITEDAGGFRAQIIGADGTVLGEGRELVVEDAVEMAAWEARAALR